MKTGVRPASYKEAGLDFLRWEYVPVAIPDYVRVSQPPSNDLDLSKIVVESRALIPGLKEWPAPLASTGFVHVRVNYMHSSIVSRGRSTY